MHFLWQLLSYSIVTWVALACIAFATARYFRWWFIPLGQLAVAAVVYWQDVNWIHTEMRKPNWDGTPDMDIVFMFGVLIRVLLINTALLPFTAIGCWLNKRHAVAFQTRVEAGEAHDLIGGTGSEGD